MRRFENVTVVGIFQPIQVFPVEELNKHKVFALFTPVLGSEQGRKHQGTEPGLQGQPVLFWGAGILGCKVPLRIWNN